jgi:cell division septum initiation protein DivIVA
MTDLHQQIIDLEAEIDAMSDAAEQCRKSMVVAKAAVGAGVLLFAASLPGLIRPDAIVLVSGIAAALAGTVFYGSSRSSLEEITRKIRASEARRAEIIDEMDLWTVEER